jgi:uncharacterized RDD family membrane protein YckC
VINPNDPRTHITHESFGVAPELIGLPLASPWRRAAGILADLLPVAILANAGLFVFLAFTSFVVVWRALSGLGGSSILRRGAAWPIRFIGAVVAFVIVLQIGGVFDSPGRGGGPPDDIGNVVVQGMMEPDDRDEDRGGIMRFVASALDDLGIGFGWGALYFTTFTVIGRGQTPGKRLVGIRVIRLDGRPVGWWLSFERFGSYFASFSTGLLGFAQIFWDRNRQALHDKAVETVVIRMPRKGSEELYARLNAARR